MNEDKKVETINNPDKHFRDYIKGKISVEQLYKKRELEKNICHDIEENMHRQSHPVTARYTSEDVKKILFYQTKNIKDRITEDIERRKKW